MKKRFPGANHAKKCPTKKVLKICTYDQNEIKRNESFDFNPESDIPYLHHMFMKTPYLMFQLLNKGSNQ